MLLLEFAIKSILMEEYNKNNNIFASCEIIEKDFLDVKLKVSTYDNHYQVKIYSSVNNNIIAVLDDIPKK